MEAISLLANLADILALPVAVFAIYIAYRLGKSNKSQK